ncbi:MAG: metallophosphoesterase [Deltaproteobacteria bacterium]|nr:metallophosphoesterase [Deltaproteobacteria bacterium]
MNSTSSNSQTQNAHEIRSTYLQPLPPEQRLINRRQVWAANRFWMEMDNMKTKRYGNKRRHHWYELLLMMKSLKWMLRLTGLYKRGLRNAKNITLKEIPLCFPNLPKEFDKFTILHLSDLHLDGMKGLENRILRSLSNRTVDLCVFTGDYRTKLHGLQKQIINGLKYLIDHIDSRQGFIGVLGNHDGCHMVNPMEQIGIHMLINGTCRIYRESERILIIGTDDVHYYYTDQALHALEHAGKEFSIALVHSPELYDMAALMGVDLYLCGHTHGGQVCLPGGKAVIKHLNRGRRYYRGHWHYRGMQGITNSGVGTSGIPVRFNTQGEILIYQLHRQSVSSYKNCNSSPGQNI